MRRSTPRSCLALALLASLWHLDWPAMSFSGPVAKARSGAGAKDYVLVMHEMCPFAQRAWFALEESGLSFRLKQVGLGSSLVYDLNPKGLVPVLVDPDGKVIVESEDIVDVIAESASKVSKAAEVASVRQLVNQRLLAAGKKAKLYGQSGDLAPVLKDLEKLVVGPYMAGDEVTAADISAAPMLQRLFDDSLVPAECTKLHAWWQAISERPTFQKTVVRSYWWWWWADWDSPALHASKTSVWKWPMPASRRILNDGKNMKEHLARQNHINSASFLQFCMIFLRLTRLSDPTCTTLGQPNDLARMASTQFHFCFQVPWLPCKCPSPPKLAKEKRNKYHCRNMQKSFWHFEPADWPNSLTLVQWIHGSWLMQSLALSDCQTTTCVFLVTCIPCSSRCKGMSLPLRFAGATCDG